MASSISSKRVMVGNFVCSFVKVSIFFSRVSTAAPLSDSISMIKLLISSSLSMISVAFCSESLVTVSSWLTTL
ncbi:hypothetical protein D1872_304870 [compost metagenome]